MTSDDELASETAPQMAEARLCDWCHEPITTPTWQVFRRSILPLMINGVTSAFDSNVIIGPSAFFCSPDHVAQFLRQQEKGGDDARR